MPKMASLPEHAIGNVAGTDRSPGHKGVVCKSISIHSLFNLIDLSIASDLDMLKQPITFTEVSWNSVCMLAYASSCKTLAT